MWISSRNPPDSPQIDDLEKAVDHIRKSEKPARVDAGCVLVDVRKLRWVQSDIRDFSGGWRGQRSLREFSPPIFLLYTSLLYF